MSARNAYSPRLESFTFRYRGEMVWDQRLHIIAEHGLVERIESAEQASPGAPGAVHENHQVARTLPVRDEVQSL